MDRTLKQEEERIRTGHERAQSFAHALGKAMNTPQPLRLSRDSGVCGFRLSSNNLVVLLYYERESSLLCQLILEVPDEINRLSCYRDILRHSFNTDPDKDGLVCVPSEDDSLVVNWKWSLNDRLPAAEVFPEYLLQADQYWSRFLREQNRL